MKYLHNLSAGAACIHEASFSKGHKVDGYKIPRRKQGNSEVLTSVLTYIADNLPNLDIPGVDATYIPQITLDKMELHIILTFPLKPDVDVKELAEPLKKLAFHVGGSKKYNPQCSLIFGGHSYKGYHEDDPSRWFSSMMRLPECRTTVHIEARMQARSFENDERPQLPGKFSAYWPEYPRNASGQRKLPVPLHTCRHLYIDCVKEETGKEEDTTCPNSTFLRVTYILDLNVNRALAHHSFMCNPKLTDEEVAKAFFPNPCIKESKDTDNFCSPELEQTDIIQAVRNTIDATMSMYYADLCRALTHVPDMPLSSLPTESWQKALCRVRLSLMEVDRHLYAEDVSRAYSKLKMQMTTLSANYRLRIHGQRTCVDDRWDPAVDETPSSISTILRKGKRRTSSSDAEVIIYKKRKNYLRMELRLRDHNGICYDMPAIPFGKNPKPTLMLNGNAYHMPKRTNVATSLEELVKVITWSMITSQDSFCRMLGTLQETTEYTTEQLADLIACIRRAVPKQEEQSALNYIISTLQERQVLRAGQAGDATVDRILRRLGDRGLFRYKGGIKTRRYYPDPSFLSVTPAPYSSVGSEEEAEGRLQGTPAQQINHTPHPGAGEAQGTGWGSGCAVVAPPDRPASSERAAEMRSRRGDTFALEDKAASFYSLWHGGKVIPYTPHWSSPPQR